MARPYLYRANRKAARISLYSSFVATGVGAFALLTVMGLSGAGYVQDLGWKPLDYASMEEVQLLRDYLRIDTTRETGDELEGARFLASILEREGIESEILAMRPGRANLIARLPGKKRGALILHNHIDVEPILAPDRWTEDPFSGHIDLPWIYGRGAFDMKSVAIAQLYAMIRAARTGITPERDLIFLATSGEETGSELGSLWLLEERPDVFDGAWGVLTEGGVVEARTPDDIKYWGTENGQKTYLEVRACSRSRDRLEDLIQDLLSEGQPLDGLRLTPEVEQFVAHYAPSRDHPAHRRQLADPLPALGDPELFHRFPRYQRSLFRDEVSPFPVRESVAVPGRYEARITLALLPGSDAKAARERLLPEWATHGVELVFLPVRGAASASDPDHPIAHAIEDSIAELFGDVRRGPYYQARSASDARYFREHGLAAYGFSPFLVLSTDTRNIGGPNESIALPAYVAGVETYVQLVARLLLTDT
ncbi:MAG: M20/M25/M40 family metallo-hydrolase [Thermoanaerobaculia bacterium]|nr:M20/M25/M40 family metallo-hydrolase [Thermoanaerobaculia bacterium]